MRTIKDVKNLIKTIRETKKLTYADGYIAASEALLRGDCPQELRSQGLSDLDQDDFTKGWLKAVNDFE